MDSFSRWSIIFSTDIFQKTGRIKYLCYDAVTKEDVSCNFVPTPEGVHAFDMERKNDGCMFGKYIIDNKKRETVTYAIS